MNWWTTCLSKIAVVPYVKSPLQTKPYKNMYKKKKRKNYLRRLFYCSPGENGLTIIPSNSPLSIALKKHGNIADLQKVLSAARILPRTTSRYTPAIFSLLLFILILCMATIWWQWSPRQLYYANKSWTIKKVLLYILNNTIYVQCCIKYHYGRIGDEHLDWSTLKYGRSCCR